MAQSLTFSQYLHGALLCGFVGGAGMGHAAPIDDVIAALRVPETIAIMIEEGRDDSVALNADDVGGAWRAEVALVYDADDMTAKVESVLRDALQGDDLEGMLAYLSSPLGKTTIEAELSARRVLLDEDVSDAAMGRVHDPDVRASARFALITAWIEANDLIDRNVQGALNSNYAFYAGMGAGQGGDAIPEEEILAQLWNSEPEIRQSTSEWSEGFALLAYSALSDDDMHRQIAFAQSPAGRQLMDASFEAYNKMFDGISFDLGHALAQIMASEAL